MLTKEAGGGGFAGIRACFGKWKELVLKEGAGRSTL
jgi:hypothetical protein